MRTVVPVRRSARLSLVALVLFTGGLLLFARSMSASGEERTGYTFKALGNVPERPLREFVPPAEPGHVSGQNVHGSDDRIRVLDTTVPNLRPVAYLELYDEFGDFAGSCSGTFIGPDAVLTAAHCLWSAETGWTGDIYVIPAKNGSYEPYGFQQASDWWVPDEWIEIEEAYDFDWGIIKLPDYSLSNLVGYRPMGSFSTAMLERNDIVPAIAGYPGDKPDGTMWLGVTTSFITVADEWFSYDIDTAGGMSGSAVLSIGNNPQTAGYIVGVHNLGGSEVNFGVRVRSALISDLNLGCRLMECTFIYYEQPQAPTPTPTRTSTATATPTVTAKPTIGTDITLVSWKFCNTPELCPSNQRISQGDEVQAQFVLSRTPNQKVSIDVHYAGGTETLFYNDPPYVGPGFVTGNLGAMNTKGPLTIDVYVGEAYVGSFTTHVGSALNFRMYSWGLSRP